MASKKKCIVSIFAIAGMGECQICFDDNRLINKLISTSGCFENPLKTSSFLDNIFSIIRPSEIKALLMTFPVVNSIKSLQAVKLKIKEFCEKNHIFCCFPPNHSLSNLGMLSAAKPSIKNGENIIIVSMALFMVNCRIHKRTSKEFVSVDAYNFLLSPDISPSRLQQLIVQNFKPSKIILFPATEEEEFLEKSKCSNTFDRVKEALSKCDVIILNEDFMDVLQIGAETLIKHLMGEKEAEYMVKFVFDREIKVSSLIKCDTTDTLPFEKSVIYKGQKDDCITVTQRGIGEIEYIDLTEFKSKQVKITLKVDENMFYDIKVDPIGPAKKDPKQHLKESGQKAKLIFTQNDYMIFAWKNGKKKLIKDSSGSTKIPFCISFVNEIPAIGEKAMKDLKEKSKFVVYDLLKLCQSNILENMSAENIDPKWPFKIIQDSETKETLIQFETFRGPRKASADFLFSLILKNSMVLIERETGVKIEEFGIEFESGGIIDGLENIKRCLEKAAERIKLKIAFL